MEVGTVEKGRAVESYIVRIYRRENGGGKTMVGTIEEVESREKKAFRTVDELCGLLCFDVEENHSPHEDALPPQK